MTNQMQFNAEQAPSLGPKFMIIGWYVCCALLAAWITQPSFAADATWSASARPLLMLACAALYIGRAAYTLLVFVKRRVPWWEAAWGGSIIGVVLFLYVRETFRATSPLGPIDLLGFALYLAGSYIGTASEHMRHRWKALPEHRGHIYTEGLFAYSRHVNYFGDLLLFTGLALLTTRPWALFVPLGMGLNFVFMIIPAHDAYLAGHYGDEFNEYARRTKRLFPMLY